MDYLAVDRKRAIKKDDNLGGIYTLPKFGERTRRGIFMGYHLHSGGKWSGDYLIMDEEAYFQAIDRRRVPVLRVREVVPAMSARFPGRELVENRSPVSVETTDAKTEEKVFANEPGLASGDGGEANEKEEDQEEKFDLKLEPE